MLMRTRHGFTLVELIVTIIIMGLLASIAIPRISQSKEAARLSEGVQILKSFRLAQERWNLDHGAFTNDCTDLDVTFTPTGFNQPTCAADGSVSIARTGGAYSITVSAANVYSCAACSGYLKHYLP